METQREQLIHGIMEDLHLLGRKIFAKRLSDQCLLPPAQRALLHIVAHKEGLSIGEIAARLQVTGSAVTQTINTLVDMGLLRRETDTTDRRTQRVSLTDVGRRQMAELRRVHMMSVSELMKPLDDRELAVLRDLCLKIVRGGNSSSEHGIKEENGL